MTASDCDANASLSSNRSIWSIVKPARSSTFRTAGTGTDPHDLRIDAGRRVRQDPRERRRARALRPSSAVVTTSAAAPSLMPDALPAVTVPSFLNAGFSAASFSAVVPARGYSSVSTRSGSPFFCGTSTGTISALKLPSCDRLRGAALTLGGERVLIGARDAVAARNLFGGDAHVARIDRAGEPFGEHRVDRFARGPSDSPSARPSTGRAHWTSTRSRRPRSTST